MSVLGPGTGSTHTNITEWQIMKRAANALNDRRQEDNGTVSSTPTESTELNRSRNQARPSQVTAPKLDWIGLDGRTVSSAC